MRATMMDFPLTLEHVAARAERLFADRAVVSRRPDRTLARTRYADLFERARRLARGLAAAGLARGGRVATLMWNHAAHLEAYFGIPLAGGVLHTLNLRLSPDDLAYIVGHAGDRFLIVDDVLLPLWEKVRDRVQIERVFVVSHSSAPLPAGFEPYELLLESAPVGQPLPRLAETDAAGMCYTSGTTGRPKGVVYSHRSIVLHSFATGLRDYLGLSNRDVLCPVVPMFHVNAWGLPFTAALVGCAIAFPGPHLDGTSLLDLFEAEGVTVSAGVPTIWHGIVAELDRAPGTRRLAPGLRMVVGGSAAPESLIRAFDRHGIEVVHGWGMTETSPVGAIFFLKAGAEPSTDDERYRLRAKQGVPLPFYEVRAMTPKGEAPWDDATMGELEVRGPWVAAAYHDPPDGEAKWTDDGWLRTGDVVTLDPHGYIRIVDRIKDLVKSGGEWISSVDLENALTAHPDVQEAAVIAVPHPHWGERPFAVVVLKPGCAAGKAELDAFLTPRFAKFWLPDGYAFVDAIPRSSTDKMMKSVLRERFRGSHQ